jgi:hypothetical protein
LCTIKRHYQAPESIDGQDKNRLLKSDLDCKALEGEVIAMVEVRERHCDGPRPSREYAALIDALEREAGPDWKLDEAIARKLGWRGGNGSWHAPGDDNSDPPYVSFPHYTGSIDAANTLLPSGFWWRGGTCGVSSEVRVCPDHNRPEHKTRLMNLCPPKIAHWNNGIEVTLWPGNDQALIRAFASACLRAHDALTVALVAAGVKKPGQRMTTG